MMPLAKSLNNANNAKVKIEKELHSLMKLSTQFFTIQILDTHGDQASSSFPSSSTFIKDSIEKNRGSNQNALLIRRSVLGKVDFERISIGKDLGPKTLWLFENETQIGCITVSFGLIVREDTKGRLAAAFSAWVSFSTTVDAASTAASGRMDQVHWISGVIRDFEGRNTKK
jgi:hypothetical protein